MSEWAAKRFWKETSVEAVDTGFAVRLDGRSVKTPAKTTLVVPTRALAEAIAAEWQAQEDKIDPNTMPFTRSANAALDKVSVQQAEVAAMLAEYGASDLICYRADGPVGLIARQAAAWDPLIDWAADRFGARLTPTTGVMFSAQDAEALAQLEAEAHKFSPFELTAFHDLVTISGSLVIGLAAVHGYDTPEVLWTASRVDELWQQEQWGDDDEAIAAAEHKRRDFLHATALWETLKE